MRGTDRLMRRMSSLERIQWNRYFFPSIRLKRAAKAEPMNSSRNMKTGYVIGLQFAPDEERGDIYK